MIASKRVFSGVGAILGAILVVASCGQSDSEDFLAPELATRTDFTQISIAPRGAQLNQGDTLRLVATGYNASHQGATASVEWSVPSGASISSTGLFSGSRAGSYLVTAKTRTEPRPAETTTGNGTP